MKTRKGIAAVLAGVMALAALPFSALSAGAESAYAPGDVDMDGYITAHDAAVVSRALYVDETALNDEQKQLADVNGDGVVDQTVRFRKVPQRRMKCTMTTVSPRCATTCWT